MKLDIPYLLQNMTLEEKAGLCSVADFWHTKAVERLGLPAVMVSDGPHGLRKQAEESDHLGINRSVDAVCFPTGAALASSFDRELMGLLGEHLGEEARAEDVHTVLGPAVNIKRSPLCGRNFEYLSEDPYLAGELAARYVNALQGKNAGVSVKHYAANNQEDRRMSVNAVVSERALREIYLAAFEKTVKQARPWTLMCAYNRLNGTYCCENEWLLNKVLREEWGFDGIVMTDWGAMDDRVQSLKAGLELEMPSSRGYHDQKIIAAVESGELSLAVLDQAVERLLRWIERGLCEEPAIPSYDKEAHHAFARRAAAECAVLLQNSRGLLPLEKTASVAFIGTFAAAPRFQGGGSSHINSFRIAGAVDAAKDLPGVTYCPGWRPDGETADSALLAEALERARASDIAVVFAGLPDSYESEGYDRAHLNLPACQNELIAEVCKVQPNVVVVLHNGSPVVLPWLDDAAAVLEMYLGGQAVGEAAVDLLFGDAEPAGRLAETFPLRLEDTPCYLNFPGDSEQVVYAEDVFVGYRWYDSRKMPVLFPFGHGLSYTRFALENLALSSEGIDADGVLGVAVDVKNIGSRAGKQVVQLYVAPPAGGAVARPLHELKGFEKVALQPGETQTVRFELDSRAFAYYDERIGGWHVPAGDYVIQVGVSSRDLPLAATVQVRSGPLPLVWSGHTTIADIVAAGKADRIREELAALRVVFNEDSPNSPDGAADEMLDAMMMSLPVHSLASFAPVKEGFVEAIRRKVMDNQC